MSVSSSSRDVRFPLLVGPQAWVTANGSKIRIGKQQAERSEREVTERSEDENITTEEIKDMYKRLLFAYQEVIATNSKRPDIIPGIVHKIIYIHLFKIQRHK